MTEPPTHSVLREGDYLGPYRVVGLLARGSHWDVYLARSGGDQRQVALKTPAAGAAPDPQAVLERAARVARLEHPNLARLYEAGMDRGRLFVAQEFVADQRQAVTDLETEMLNHGHRLPEERVRVLGKHLLDGLAAAHAAPDGGLVHGRLTAGKVLLSAQRRAKLIDVGLATPTSAEGKADDCRAVAALLYRMLCGRELAPDAPPPQQFGVSPKWGPLIRALATTRADSLPDLADLSEQVLALDNAPPPHHRWAVWLPVAAGVLLLLLAAVAGLTVRARRQALEKARVETVAKAEAERAARLGALLDAARRDLDAKQPEAALEACRQALALDSRHPQALKLLAECRTAAGTAHLGDVKTRAEAAWNGLRKVHPGEGFADLVGEARSLMTAARNALASQEYAQAATLFRQAAERAEAVATLDAERRAAAPLREEVESARESAEAVEAPGFATALWQQAAERDKTGQDAYGTRRFPEAVAAWKEALGLYARAERKAVGSRRVGVARIAFQKAHEAAGEVARTAMPAETRNRVQAATERAAALAEQEDWPGAVAAWDEALRTFEGGLVQSDDVLRRRHFDEAMARARHTFSRDALAETEKSLTEALGLQGYGDHPEARALLAEVRERRAKAGDTKPARGANLVLNGDFTVSQAGAPVGWTRPDNLTVFWEEGGVRGKGKCLRMDTDVYRSEWEEHRKAPETPVKKTPTSGTKYDTVGGTAGVAVYSHPLMVEPGGCYRVGYDVRGQGEPFVFVLGYWKCGPEHLKSLGEKILFKPVPGGPSFSLVAFGTSGEEKRQPLAGDFIQCYRRRVVARFPPGKEGTWRHYETVLQFPADSPVQVALLELYAYWPPGEYWFDNIRCEPVTSDDLKAYEARRESLGAEANFGSAVGE